MTIFVNAVLATAGTVFSLVLIAVCVFGIIKLMSIRD